jgi:hypothetical protein
MLLKKKPCLCRVTPEITAQLLATMDNKVESGDILATQLCSHMQEANLINTSRLNNLAGINTPSFLMCDVLSMCLAWISGMHTPTLTTPGDLHISTPRLYSPFQFTLTSAS